MILSMIAGMSENRVIWKDNALPRYYPEDLKKFRAITYWNCVIMWRNTYESIWKPLPWRRNIVISKSTEFSEIECYESPDEAIERLEFELWDEDQVFIIWWATLYSYFLPQAEYIYLTKIHKVIEGDTYFPPFEEHFELIESNTEKDLTFMVYRKKRAE